MGIVEWKSGRDMGELVPEPRDYGKLADKDGASLNVMHARVGHQDTVASVSLLDTYIDIEITVTQSAV